MRTSLIMLIVAWTTAQASEPTPDPQAAFLSAQQGWAALKDGQTQRALGHYLDATRADPGSESAWLGVQWSAVLLGRYALAEEAGEAALRLDENCFWAAVRLGLARYAQADYHGARWAYAKATELEPESGEAHLGLGLTEVRLGEVSDGHASCRRAAIGLGDDPRVHACLADRGDSLRVHATFAATFLSANGGALSSLAGFSLSAGVEWPWGVGLWSTVNHSASTLNADGSDFDQTAAIVGAWISRNNWTAALSVGGVASSSDDVSGTAVVVGDVGYRWKNGLGLGVKTSVAAFSVGPTAQIEPWLEWRATGWLTLTAGPSIAVVSGSLLESGENEVLISGQLGVTVRPLSRLTVGASAFYGQQRYRIDQSGASVWTSSDRFTGGYDLSASWEVWGPLALYGAFTHRFGDQSAGESADFQVLGGTVGVRASF